MRQSPALTFYPKRSRGAAVTTLSYDYPADEDVPEHFHDEDQLVYAVCGVMTLRAARGLWVVPPIRERKVERALIGQRLSHFRIVAKLGHGGMGVVYRATDETLRRDVALKVLPGTVAESDERRRRFLREARSAAAVTHPNIATVYEVGEADGHLFIAMELVAGQTLRDRMAAGLSFAEASTVARQIASGLARAHEKGVVHRDLKPENVMLTPEGEVKLLDFGLAKLGSVEAVDAAAATATQLSEVGQVMGTPAYMSPEQAAGRSEIDARTDVFSFGVMLYELLSGVRPFRGETTIEILYALTHREPTPLDSLRPDVPAELAAVVARCLRKASQERFGSGGELLTALGTSARPGTPPSEGAQAAEKIVTVGGMGAALEATLVRDAPDAPDARGPGHSEIIPLAAEPRRTEPSSAARSLRIGAIVVALLGIAGGGWTLRTRTRSPASPRDQLLGALDALKGGASERKPVADCRAAYETFKRLLPSVQPMGENDPVKFGPANVWNDAPLCFARAGDCAEAWTVFQEAWRLDRFNDEGSRRDTRGQRTLFESITGCARARPSGQ